MQWKLLWHQKFEGIRGWALYRAVDAVLSNPPDLVPCTVESGEGLRPTLLRGRMHVATRWRSSPGSLTFPPVWSEEAVGLITSVNPYLRANAHQQLWSG